PVVDAVVETIRGDADAKRIEVAVDGGAPTTTIDGDVHRLHQVLGNLLANAVKFTPEGGEVRVRLARSRSHALLEVSDTGVGIAAESMPHLFERFWQQETDAAPRSRGLGLGLAIVRNLVDLHGGVITAHSAGVGSGASFRITLPLVESRSESPAAQVCEA
ncbi:MAG TPA: ATP-binding protein, partial [Candidatus Bathyarchaeia archaeon]|nr:ATP-binding protein [Candidatus Bathyarchaeia archaeon]